MSGWVKLHRSLTEWEWYYDIPTSRLFIHLLITANHEPKKWQGMTIDRGQKVTSLDNLSRETGLSVRQVRTALKRLKTTGEVTSQTTSKYTRLTIEKYSFYQDRQSEETSETTSGETNERQTNDKRTTTTKEVKKLRSKEVRSICPEPSSDDSRPVIELMTNRYNTTGEVYRVTEKQVAEFESIYPSVDVRQQLRNMRGWLINNPVKRKTTRGMPKFMNAWLTDKQDKGGNHAKHTGNTTGQREELDFDSSFIDDEFKQDIERKYGSGILN